MKTEDRLNEFDQERAQALRRIWFVGDVHGYFKHLAQAMLDASERPSWIVFAGDIDIDHKPFREILAPLWRFAPDTQIAFIHGNHDADTHENWQMMHDCGDAVALHCRVVDMGGVRVGGLGGHFVGRAWMPPAPASFSSRSAVLKQFAKPSRGELPAPVWNSAIFPDEVDRLAKQRADILITHEAPSCHRLGFEVLDDLARKLMVKRAFHGHHHDDRTAEYKAHRERLGFDAVGLRFCQIKNGLGEEIFEGEKNW